MPRRTTDPPNANRVASRRLRGAVIAIDIVAVIVCGALIGLGVWQVERRAWKLDLIARVEARIHAAPSPLPARAAWPAITSADAYTRVRATGALQVDDTTFVQAVTEFGGGFWAMTPLRLADGTIVLVNQGFVPPDRRDYRTWRTHTAGEATVTGLLRPSEPGGAFLRSNDPVDGRWFSRDVAAIAAAHGLANVAPFFIDAEALPGEGGYPIAGLTVVAFHNNHLVYALTWFALAAMVAGGAAFLTRDAFRAPATLP